MKPFTPEELSQAFGIWNYDFEFKSTDKLIEPLLNSEISKFEKNNEGWLKRARKAQIYSLLATAQKLNVTKATYSEYEKSEELGTISLNTLAEAADAMDCEFVYFLRPKSKESFSRMIWNKLATKSLKHPWLEKCDQKRRGAALAKIIKDNFHDTEFRRKQGWSTHA